MEEFRYDHINWEVNREQQEMAEIGHDKEKEEGFLKKSKASG